MYTIFITLHQTIDFAPYIGEKLYASYMLNGRASYCGGSSDDSDIFRSVCVEFEIVTYTVCAFCCDIPKYIKQ